MIESGEGALLLSSEWFGVGVRMNRVLVIDDDPMVRNVVAEGVTYGDRFLAVKGATGDDLARFLAAHDDVVAVVCDQRLVGETGIDVHARVEPTLRARNIAFFLLHGFGGNLRAEYPDGYLEERQIVELRKPLRSILELPGIIDEEVRRMRG